MTGKKGSTQSRSIFKAQIRAIRRWLRGATDGPPFESAMAGRLARPSWGLKSLPIYSASLFLCMQWIFAAAPSPWVQSAHDRQAKSGI
jgi:hypothetical protein